MHLQLFRFLVFTSFESAGNTSEQVEDLIHRERNGNELTVTKINSTVSKNCKVISFSTVIYAVLSKVHHQS